MRPTIRLEIVKGPTLGEFLRAEARKSSLRFVLSRGTVSVTPERVREEAGTPESFLFRYQTDNGDGPVSLEGYCNFSRGAVRGWIQIFSK